MPPANRTGDQFDTLVVSDIAVLEDSLKSLQVMPSVRSKRGPVHQLKFKTKDFEAEYFHYTGDLFFIYKSGHLMRLICKPA